MNKILVWVEKQSIYTAHFNYDLGAVSILKDGKTFLIREKMSRLQLQEFEEQIRQKGLMIV